VPAAAPKASNPQRAWLQLLCISHTDTAHKTCPARALTKTNLTTYCCDCDCDCALRADHLPATTRPTPARFGPPIDSRFLQAQPAAAKRDAPYCRDSLRDPLLAAKSKPRATSARRALTAISIAQPSAPRPARPASSTPRRPVQLPSCASADRAPVPA
jgi:hypothetical protein